MTVGLAIEKRTAGGAEKNAVEAVLSDREDEIAAEGLGMQKIVAQQLDFVAIVATKSIDGSVPEIAFAVLKQTVDTEHRQFGYLRNGT